MKRIILLAVIINWLFINALTAQNPFKEFGVDVPVITLSKGKYPEFIPNDTIHRIGTVVIDTRTGKIIELINTDSIEVTYNYRPDVASRWISPDPLTEEYRSWSPYNYTMGNPIKFIDPDGREPIKPYVGTAYTFFNLFNNTPSKIGLTTGANASAALLRLGETEMTFKGTLPLTTPYFNNKKGRYVYTSKGGWVDMVHFLFYAGKAYTYHTNGETNPIGEAMQDGYQQEYLDPKHSSYSYEDLPSDKFGATFAVDFFDPTSKLSLGEQIYNYLVNELGATLPEWAPNYSALPEKESKNEPTQTNETTEPMHTSTDEELIRKSNDKTSKNQY